MADTIRDLLKEDFQFDGVLGGPEFDSLPKWQQRVADNLLEQGMAYHIAKINLDTATKKSDEYNKWVRKYLKQEVRMMPLWSKPGNVPELLLMFEMVKAEIERLIRVYNAN